MKTPEPDLTCPWCRGTAAAEELLPEGERTATWRCTCGAVLFLGEDGEFPEVGIRHYFALLLDDRDLGRLGVLLRAVDGGSWASRPGVNPLDGKVMEHLSRIERGEVVLSCPVEPQEEYMGCIEYSGSDGSAIGVYIDCNQWKALEWIRFSDGQLLGDELLNTLPRTRIYAPDPELCWLRYGVPGYLTHLDERWTGTRGVRSLDKIRARRDAVETELDASGFLRVRVLGSPDARTLAESISGGGATSRNLLVDLSLTTPQEPTIATLAGAADIEGRVVVCVVTPSQKTVFELLGIRKLRLTASDAEAREILRAMKSGGGP